MGVISEEARQRYAGALREHQTEIDAELAKYTGDVQEFMRANFRLALYPLSFLQDFAPKLDAFRKS